MLKFTHIIILLKINDNKVMNSLDVNFSSEYDIAYLYYKILNSGPHNTMSSLAQNLGEERREAVCVTKKIPCIMILFVSSLSLSLSVSVDSGHRSRRFMDMSNFSLLFFFFSPFGSGQVQGDVCVSWFCLGFRVTGTACMEIFYGRDFERLCRCRACDIIGITFTN